MFNLSIKERVHSCFTELKEDLVLGCDSNPPAYVDFVFTPDASTPDTIYYQVTEDFFTLL